MANYSLIQTRTFRKALAKLPADIVGRLVPPIKELADEPFPPGVSKLRGKGAVYRLRVGDYRIIYEVDTDERVVDLLLVGHRRDIYRKL